MSFSIGLSGRVRSNAIIKLTSEVIGRLVSFILVLWAARQLGEADFGRYNYGLALGFILAQLADLGFQVLLAREIAAAGRAAKPLVLIALRLKLLLSLPVILLLILITAAWPVTLRLSLLALGLTLLLQTYLEFVAYVFRGEQQLMKEAQLLAGARLATAVIGMIVLAVGGGLLGLALAQLSSTLILAVWALWWLRQAGWLDPLPTIFQLNRTHSAQATRYLLVQALPIGISIFLSIAYTRLAILILQYRLGEVAVAHFSAAYRLVEPAQILPASLVAAAFPAFTALLPQAPNQAWQMGLRLSRLLAVCGVAVAFTFWVTAPWLIPLLYGPQFHETIPVLQWLGLSVIPAFINYSLTHYLIARGQQKIMGILTAVMLLLHAGLSWLLIPHWGVIGPTSAIIAAEMALLIGCLLTLTLTSPPKQAIQPSLW
jgi:O-antigen/teichoic acid export membrane protein